MTNLLLVHRVLVNLRHQHLQHRHHIGRGRILLGMFSVLKETERRNAYTTVGCTNEMPWNGVIELGSLLHLVRPARLSFTTKAKTSTESR